MKLVAHLHLNGPSALVAAETDTEYLLLRFGHDPTWAPRAEWVDVPGCYEPMQGEFEERASDLRRGKIRVAGAR